MCTKLLVFYVHNRYSTNAFYMNLEQELNLGGCVGLGMFYLLLICIVLDCFIINTENVNLFVLLETMHTYVPIYCNNEKYQ